MQARMTRMNARSAADWITTTLFALAVSAAAEPEPARAGVHQTARAAG